MWGMKNVCSLMYRFSLRNHVKCVRNSHLFIEAFTLLSLTLSEFSIQELLNYLALRFHCLRLTASGLGHSRYYFSLSTSEFFCYTILYHFLSPFYTMYNSFNQKK